MNKDHAPENDETDSSHNGRRRYVAPTVSDFFQPVVVLGTTNLDGCAAPRPPKH